MTTLMTTAPASGRTSTVRLRRFTVAEYQALIEAKVLREGEPVELLDGLLVEKMTRNPPHDLALTLLAQELIARVPLPAWVCRVQCAITLPESVPEPDVIVARGPARRYAARHPDPTDIALLVEVSDASLDFDQGVKLRLYAAAGISEYWIVNIPDHRVEVYTRPTGTGDQATYGQQQLLTTGDAIQLVPGSATLPAIPVADILP